MPSSPPQVSYRAIFNEMLLAQTAAINTLADMMTRCAKVATRQASSRNQTEEAAGSGYAGGGAETSGAAAAPAADLGRALAGLPRISMIMFLAQYDNLRRQRSSARD
jgi:hypothetical protein